jgi:hypothetical protein
LLEVKRTYDPANIFRSTTPWGARGEVVWRVHGRVPWRIPETSRRKRLCRS